MNYIRSPIRGAVGSPLNPNKGVGGPQFPFTPLVDLDARYVAGVSKRYMPSHGAAAATANIIGLNTGLIGGAGSNCTVTKAYADGPTSVMSATRLQIASNGFLDLYQATTAVTETLVFKARSTAGAGAQTFRYGDFTGTKNTVTVDETGWTTCSVDITAGARRIMILHNSITADILIDEVQIEPPTPGAFVTRPGHGYPRYAVDNALTMTGGAVDTSGAGVVASLPLPAYPAATTFTEGTIWAVMASDNVSQIASKIISASGGNGSADVGSDVGNAYGNPAYARNQGSRTRLVGKGYHVVISTWKAGAQAFYIDGVPHTVTTATLASFSRRAMGFLGDPLDDASATWGNFPFRGKLTKAGVASSWVDDAGAAQLYTRLAADHLATGEGALPKINFMDIEGDSITAAGTYDASAFDVWTSQIFGAMSAVSGTALASGANSAMTRQAMTLRRVVAAKALGHYPIVSLFHGANGIPTVAEYHAYIDPLRAAGAKLLFCPIIHKVGDASFNSLADARNADTLAEGSALYDARVAFEGVLTETIGVDYTDATHPNAAGQAKLAPPWKTAAETLFV